MMRIDKYLAEMGQGTRSEIKLDPACIGIISTG